MLRAIPGAGAVCHHARRLIICRDADGNGDHHARLTATVSAPRNLPSTIGDAWRLVRELLGLHEILDLRPGLTYPPQVSL